MITVALTTWPSHPRRVAYLERTALALRYNLMAPRSEIAWLVSAESEHGSDAPWAGDALTSTCARLGLPLVWRDGPANLPGHLNDLFARAFAETSCVLYVQDDWELMRALPLAGSAWHLQETPDLAGIRFWVGPGVRYQAATVPGMREINLTSDWSYGDNPALWHRRFFERCGPFRTNGDFGTHEHEISWKLAGSSGLRVWTPLETSVYGDHWFRHIGAVTSVPNDARWPDAPRRSDPKHWGAA